MGEALIIDVSEGVGVINFSEVAKHVTGEKLPVIHGAIVRLTEGSIFDDRGIQNYLGFRSIGLPVGVYGWHNPSDSALNNKTQALKLVAGIDALPEYPLLGVWGDYETDKKGLNFEQMRQAIWKYINTFETEFDDVTLGIYTRKYWWDENVANDTNGYTDIPKDRDLWVSNPGRLIPLMPLDWEHRYGSNSWILHQDKWHQELSGCPGEVDYNTFNGNLTAYRQYFGLEQLPPPPEPEPVEPIQYLKRVKVTGVTTYLNVRGTPDPFGPDLGELYKNTVVPVSEIDGDWYRINGWVHKGYCTDV